MTRLHLHSERFSPSGSISAQGAKNTLGRPRLGLPELLVRESLQNSCDAQDPDSDEPVRFSVEHHTLTDDEREALRTAFVDTPRDKLPLADSLERSDLALLILADRGTTGLGGPTRADVAHRGDISPDFVDLLRNIGQPRDKDFGSGTYGYGKSVLFRASQASTIVVHTRCRLDDGTTESRLLAAALGHNHRHDGVLMTGRHWWGRQDADVGAEPLLNEDADDLARRIGLPSIEGTGSTIAMVDPDLGTDPDRVGERIADSAVFYAWPRLAGIEGVPPLELSVVIEGRAVAIPDPAHHPHLSGFVTALRKLHEGDSETLSCLRPIQELGRFTFETVSPPPLPRLPYEEDDDRPTLFSDGVHHTALMRHGHLVIKYRPGSQHPLKRVAWAAVFLADDEVDQAFAESEPPSHDDWNPELLPTKSHKKRFVRVAKTRIDEQVDAKITPAPAEPAATDGAAPLGRLGDSLADLVTLSHGPRTGPDTRQPAAGSRKKTQRARVTIEHRWPELTSYGPILKVAFSAQPAEGTTMTQVDANVAWALDDGATSDTDGPEPVGWTDPAGVEYPPGPVTVGPGTWTLTVPQPDGLGLIVDIAPETKST